ncbi:molybdopterin-dependent oxidoreductase [Novosphingobium sp. TH158]|uniref:molybdopterin-dependent oxidoreductase n=1 Tax=Novosphingobium sp. TH158 TaxID=2067455 RepID=UPI000C7D1B08|nr:molybdopterin-dependent oxidoreductase [Novosphingobium sp. TH158]PLK27593.1 molybdopterin-binding protein [Novosphingobium sp. TH158]
MAEPLSRRRLLSAGALGAGGLLLGGCDRLTQPGPFRSLLEAGADAHYAVQRGIAGNALAPEFAPSQRSPVFRANGNLHANGNAAWASHLADGFARWALRVDGLVLRPLDLPLEALRGMPQRSQITRHDCVEGWSAIGKWQGPQLGPILKQAGLLPAARFIVFHCADSFGSAPYYESLDLIEAHHPQTILAWAMNDLPLPVAHGAPIRLRAERQLGYKHAKYVMRIEARSSLAGLYGGKGGYWEDARGYQWWAGI